MMPPSVATSQLISHEMQASSLRPSALIIQPSSGIDRQHPTHRSDAQREQSRQRVEWRWGGERGRTADEVVGSTLMKGSSSALHKAIVPPAALFVIRGRSGQRVSSLFKWKEYFGWNMEKEAAMSQWKIWGSERNTKTGENSSTKYNRLRQFRLQPSMFQVIIGRVASE